MALGSTALAEVSFDLDQALCAGERRDRTEEGHVFVAGLARAGTTILMRRLFQTGAFHSLTYRDMPFVLAPNLWRRIEKLGARSMSAVERAHGDGLLVDFDSPEALEEVFWRVICGADYLLEDRLIPMTAAPEAIEKFRCYVAALLQGQPQRRYLSKNNNNILRLPDIARAFPQATIIVPFRTPIAQAESLLRQHQRFSQGADDSGFTRRYMHWLAHHEFGPGHRPFVFHGERPQGDPAQDLGYWLQIWTATYSHLLEQAPARTLFLSYEQLCGATERVWPALCERLELPDDGPSEALRAPRPMELPAVDGALLRQANALHVQLLARAL
jgi:hypothetical protein